MTERQIEKWMLDDKYLNEENDSYVYFILHGYDGYMDAIENPDNKNYKLQWDEKSYVKVGISKDPQKRLTAIQLSSPIKLTCLGYLPANEDIEKKIHRCLKKHHSRGEWFKYNGSVHEYIDSLYLLDYKGQPQPSYYDKKYPSSCFFENNGARVRLVDSSYYEADKDIPNMMRLLFGDCVQNPVARKAHIDDFNDIIDAGESYWKTGLDYNYPRKFSERTIRKVMMHFGMEKICKNALESQRAADAEIAKKTTDAMGKHMEPLFKNN